MSRVESDDGTVTEDSAMGQWGKFFDEGGKKIGMSFTVVEDGIQRKAMEEAGFTDIAEHTFKVRNGKEEASKPLHSFRSVWLVVTYLCSC